MRNLYDDFLTYLRVFSVWIDDNEEECFSQYCTENVYESIIGSFSHINYCIKHKLEIIPYIQSLIQLVNDNEECFVVGFGYELISLYKEAIDYVKESE